MSDWTDLGLSNLKPGLVQRICVSGNANSKVARGWRDSYETHKHITPVCRVISKRTAKIARPAEVVGWRELVGLPDFGIEEMRAKVDTGARTSALYAVDKKLFKRSGIRWVRFTIPITGHPNPERVEAPVFDERNVKNTSGIPERRLVIRTALLIGRHRWHIDVSLADREKMEFNLILGRTAFHGRNMLVHPDHSYNLGPPSRVTSKKISPKYLTKLEVFQQGEEE